MRVRLGMHFKDINKYKYKYKYLTCLNLQQKCLYLYLEKFKVHVLKYIADVLDPSLNVSTRKCTLNMFVLIM